MRNPALVATFSILVSLSTTAQPTPATGSGSDDAAYDALAKRSLDLVGKLVAAKPITGSEDGTVKIIESRIKALGLDYQLISSEGGRPNFVIRLNAAQPTKHKALLILAHIDVVTAEGQTWSTAPHEMTFKNGFVQGRGVVDDLGYLAAALEVVGELKNSKTRLERDVILMLNSDEEKGGVYGVQWLMKNRPELFENIEYALNEGGSVVTDNEQKPLFLSVAAAEKIYQDYKLVARGPTGHSSVPPRENSMYAMAAALSKLERNPFTPRLLEITQSYFRERAKVEPVPELKKVFVRLAAISRKEDKDDLSIRYKKDVQTLEKHPNLNALIRTTCVATVINGGVVTAKNALPPETSAYVNCRLLPDENVDKHTATLRRLLEIDPQKADVPGALSLSVTPEFRFLHAASSPLQSPVMTELNKLADGFFRGLPVIPSLQTGGTDSRFLRTKGIPAYGIGPVMLSEEDRKRPHGVDERFYVGNYALGIRFYHQLVLNLAAHPSERTPANQSLSPLAPSRRFEDAFGPIGEPWHDHKSVECAN